MGKSKATQRCRFHRLGFKSLSFNIFSVATRMKFSLFHILLIANKSHEKTKTNKQDSLSYNTLAFHYTVCGTRHRVY